MTADLLRIVLLFSALAGGIVSGLVMAKAKPNTKWMSKLGIWAIVSLMLLLVGLGGTVILTI
jgi:hypothetical protein